MSLSKDILQLSDRELCEKLKREDHEHYITLVRMHLSFVLDINTEDNNCNETNEKSKFRPLKWVGSAKKKPLKGIMEGAPLTQEGICQVYQIIEYLSREQNITQEGIFRRTGNLSRQQDLKNLLNSGADLQLDEGKFSVHDCASVLKGFLSELPEPLLKDSHYQAYFQLAEMCEGSEECRLLRALQLLQLLLPCENQLLFKDVLTLLHLAASHENSNKMSPDNLAKLFAPHLLLCPQKLAPEEFHINAQVMSKVISFMITKGTELFNIPPKLATDIRAYWADRNRKEGQHGEEVNTVFSFVDRQLTAEANLSNPTEAALAKLYAHIQGMPESAKKKKLVKQFNKENGHGTPLHITRSKKDTQRSLGDSIKKHIFPKALKKNKAINSSTEDLLKTPEKVKKSELIVNTPATVKMSHNKSQIEHELKEIKTNEIISHEKELKVSEPLTSPKLTPDTNQKPISSSSPSSSSSSSTESLNSQGQGVIVSSSIEYISSQEQQYQSEYLTCIDTPQIKKSSIIWEHDIKLSPTPNNIIPNEFQTPNCIINKRSVIWEHDNMTTSTPATVFTTPASVICNRSMSPITRSTRRMPLSMQETMMTPRSRKPVIVPSNSNMATQFATRLEEEDEIEDNSDTALASPFKNYLISRSVLTASPVSLSAAASPDKLSNSLLYCLDGNDPSCDESSGSSRKRSADSSLFADQSLSLSSDSAKKSTLESSFASTLGSTSHVRETSL